MVRVFVIQDLRGGYWCRHSKQFRGWAFAAYYASEGDAFQDIEEAVQQSPCEIKPVYIKVKVEK